ncbi:MAG: acyl-CoA dehydrogenase family protein [Acidimicrobiia bacterium]
MDLSFSEEQDMLREMVRGVCSSYSPLDTVRAMEDDPTGYPAELWKQLGELDLIGLTLPVEYGGSGLSMLDATVVYEELGRGLVPSPHFVSAVMSGGALLRGGSASQKAAWLPKIASGEEIVTVAWLEPERGFGPQGVALEARPGDGDGFVLEGVKWHVPFAAAASRFLVLARSGDAINLFLVESGAPGITLDQQQTIASDTQYQVTFAGTPAERIGDADWSTWHDTMLDGIILQAALAAGGASYALEITVQYAKDREQFDKPLGAFQAISHYLADASTTVEGATILVREAAWARANGRDVDRLAPMAKLFAASTFRDVTAMAQQVFGGVGFTLEYDIQLYFRRAKQLQISWWDDRYLEELIADATL